jgi:hypothetical protein
MVAFSFIPKNFFFFWKNKILLTRAKLQSINEYFALGSRITPLINSQAVEAKPLPTRYFQAVTL